MLAHFGNSGMRETLADNLNLTGTARYNLQIRFKLRLVRSRNPNPYSRAKIPAAWETVVPYFNHSELSYVNDLATMAGVLVLPFKDVERLPADNGERFFSEYLLWMKQQKPQHDINDLCLCPTCKVPPDSADEETETNPRDDNNVARVSQSNVPAQMPVEVNDEPTTRDIIPRAQLPQLPMQQQPFHAAPFIPTALWINPYVLPSWPNCCEKFVEYNSRDDKRGCPPHNKGCPNRILRIRKTSNK